MSNLSDAIEFLLKQMLDDNEGVIEFTRNDLATELNCVPSQITYVANQIYQQLGLSQGEPARRRRVYHHSAHFFCVAAAAFDTSN